MTKAYSVENIKTVQDLAKRLNIEVGMSTSMAVEEAMTYPMFPRARRVVGGMIGVSVGGGEGINVGFVGTTVGANVQ